MIRTSALPPIGLPRSITLLRCREEFAARRWEGHLRHAARDMYDSGPTIRNIIFFESAQSHDRRVRDSLLGHLSPGSRTRCVLVGTRSRTRTIRVECAGTVVADSPSCVVVFETGLPTRYYLDQSCVAFEHLVPSLTRTECP